MPKNTTKPEGNNERPKLTIRINPRRAAAAFQSRANPCPTPGSSPTKRPKDLLKTSLIRNASRYPKEVSRPEDFIPSPPPEEETQQPRGVRTSLANPIGLPWPVEDAPQVLGAPRTSMINPLGLPWLDNSQQQQPRPKTSIRHPLLTPNPPGQIRNLTNAPVNDGVYYLSTIKNCTVINCKLTECTIEAATMLADCELINCTFPKGTLMYNCIVRFDDVDDGASDGAFTQKAGFGEEADREMWIPSAFPSI